MSSPPSYDRVVSHRLTVPELILEIRIRFPLEEILHARPRTMKPRKYSAQSIFGEKCENWPAVLHFRPHRLHLHYSQYKVLFHGDWLNSLHPHLHKHSTNQFNHCKLSIDTLPLHNARWWDQFKTFLAKNWSQPLYRITLSALLWLTALRWAIALNGAPWSSHKSSNSSHVTTNKISFSLSTR